MITNPGVITALGQVLQAIGFFNWFAGAITAGIVVMIFSLVVELIKDE